MRMNISIRTLDEGKFEVTVGGERETTHTVSVDPKYHVKLTMGSVTPADLVRLSFEFLLEREPNTSILSSFDLSVISRYFPEFESEIAKVLGH